LELSCGWPHYAGLCFVHGFENDRYIGVNYIKYNGDGTSGYGGAEGYEGDNTTLLSFGYSTAVYTVKCPGETSGDHNLKLSASSGALELKYKLIY
jgi:hypothetical protein